MEERPREALLEAHNRCLQLPASASRSSGTPKLGAAVAEVVSDGAAGGEPLRPSVAHHPGRGGGGDGAQPEGAAPAARAGGAQGGGERGGGRRSRREHRWLGLGFGEERGSVEPAVVGASDERGGWMLLLPVPALLVGLPLSPSGKMGFVRFRSGLACVCAVTELWARQGSDEMGGAGGCVVGWREATTSCE